jgi:hypothetical protein
MPKSLLKLVFLGATVVAFAISATTANAQDKVRWKMQSAFASSLTHAGTSGVRSARTSTECLAASSR